jgi:hypothetical protein
MEQNKRHEEKESYLLSLIILLIGIVLFILAFIIDTQHQYLEWLLFFISLPLIILGYIGVIHQTKLETACLIEGFVALLIPLLMSTIIIIVKSGWRVSLIILILIILIGIASLALGIYGHLKSRAGQTKVGQKIRVLLFITLAIGVILTFGIVQPIGY